MESEGSIPNSQELPPVLIQSQANPVHITPSQNSNTHIPNSARVLQELHDEHKKHHLFYRSYMTRTPNTPRVLQELHEPNAPRVLQEQQGLNAKHTTCSTGVT
jgi:hypothetical protein